MIASREYVIKKMTELTANAKRRYAQNFLTDEEIAKKAVAALGENKNLAIIEIGPGLGALTEVILKEGFSLTAYEIDSLMIDHLKSHFGRYASFSIVEGDFLKQNLSVEKECAAISSIPYNLTTPIIEKVILSEIPLKYFVFMLQKEAGMRITARKGNRDYGPLPILLSYLGKIETVCKVGRDRFIPAPNVDSVILKMTFRENRDFDEEKRLYRLLQVSFRMRRKTIANNLNGFLMSREEWQQILTKLSISPSKRPEELDLSDYLNILTALSKKEAR